MTIFDNITLSLAMGVMVLLVVHNCSTHASLKLSKGLFVSALIALFHAISVLLGWSIGKLFQFGFPDYDNLLFLGFLSFVAIKIFVSDYRRGKEPMTYDINNIGTSLLLAVASGVNTFLVGVGLGFVDAGQMSIFKLAVPMFFVVLLFALWGVMLGRQKVEMNGRRWTLLAILMIFIIALRGTFWV